MNKKASVPEKAKPFRLVKYFTFTSLVVIFIGTVVLSFLTTHWVRSVQYEKSREFARLLVESLNHQVFMQFILPVGLKYGKIELRNQEQFERMDSVVRSTLHSFKVDMVNIYGMNDIIAYSFSKELIGLQNMGGTSYKKALSGQLTSKMVQKGSFFELLIGVPKEVKIITFAPLRAEKPLSPISGPVLGVVEIVQDLSNDYRRIFRVQVLTLITVSGVMSLLFGILIYVVKRGEDIIRKRAMEQLKLKEQLSQTKHLSSLGEMVAGISHEIRNPLGIISSSAELLKKKIKKDSALIPIANIISEESARLNTIITDFLNYARPQSPNLYPCNLIEIIEKNIAFLEPQIEKQNYKIQVDFPSKPVKVMADADMLYQAFLNILINAMQAMPNGGDLSIAVKTSPEGVMLLFDDSGSGIPAAIKSKIWDPFFTTKDKGSGLGLGIVKKIIEAHGGQIRLDNRPGGGTRVIVKIPFHHGD